MEQHGSKPYLSNNDDLRPEYNREHTAIGETIGDVIRRAHVLRTCFLEADIGQNRKEKGTVNAASMSHSAGII